MKKKKSIHLFEHKAKSINTKQIHKVKGGATEELFGAYHFLLEVSSIQSGK